MTKEYVILAHSNINKKAPIRNVPENLKLVLPAKCGQSLSRNMVFQHPYFFPNVVKKLLAGKNVTENLKRTMDPAYYRHVNRFFNVSRKGVQHTVYNKKFQNQTLSFSQPEVRNGQIALHFGVYRLPLDILAQKNISNKSLLRLPSNNSTFEASLSGILRLIKKNAGSNKNVSVFGHFCRSLKRINIPDTKRKPIEITGDRKVHRVAHKSFKKLMTLRSTPHKLGLTGRRIHTKRGFINLLAAKLKDPNHVTRVKNITRNK